MAAIGNTCILIVQGRPRSRAGRGGGGRPKVLSESRTCFLLGEAPPPLAGTRPAVAAEGVSRGRSGAGGGGAEVRGAPRPGKPQFHSSRNSRSPPALVGFGVGFRSLVTGFRPRGGGGGRKRGSVRAPRHSRTSLRAGDGPGPAMPTGKRARTRGEGPPFLSLPPLPTSPTSPTSPAAPAAPWPGAKPGLGPGGRAGADGGPPEAAVARPLPRPGGRPPWGPAGLGSPWGGGPRRRAGGWRLLRQRKEVIPEGGQAGRGGACGGGDRGGNPGPRTRASPKSPPDAVNSSVCVWAAGRGGGAQEPGR